MAEISRDVVGIRRGRATRWRVARYVLILAAVLVVAGLWLFRVPVFLGNFHTVIPNEVYRSAQLSPLTLERRIRELGLRSVINLRTDDGNASWSKSEHEVTEVRGVDLHLVRLSVFMPPRATLQRLVRLLDTAKRPLLLHCLMGVERSGIASAIAILLEGGDVAEARKQFGLVYGFLPLICKPDLPEVLDDYGRWLGLRGASHSPDLFRHWVKNDYTPYFYRARLEPLDVPTSLTKGSKAVLRFRATNASPQVWRFLSESDRGVHFGARIWSLDPSIKRETELRGGYRDLTVAPGEAVVLELEIPAFLEPGRYQFLVDLVDEQVKWFSDMGSEPFTFELRVKDSAPP